MDRNTLGFEINKYLVAIVSEPWALGLVANQQSIKSNAVVVAKAEEASQAEASGGNKAHWVTTLSCARFEGWAWQLVLSKVQSAYLCRSADKLAGCMSLRACTKFEETYGVSRSHSCHVQTPETDRGYSQTRLK